MTERRVCEHCGAELSQKWGQGFCPLCGKSIMPHRVVPRSVRRTPAQEPERQIQEPAPQASYPTGQYPAEPYPAAANSASYPAAAAERPKYGIPPIERVEIPPVPRYDRQPTRKRPQRIPRKDRFDLLMTAAENSQAPVLLFLSPMLLLLQNVLTLGMRGIYWFRFHEDTLETLAHQEAALPPEVPRMWKIFLYCHLACVSCLIWECLFSGWKLSVVVGSVFLKPAVFFFIASSITFRYILFWMRWVIIENVFDHLADIKRARSLKPFAPAALLLWFFGSTYLQLHINRLIWAGVFRPHLMRGAGSSPKAT